MFCYVGSVFAPALDEGIGNLWSVSQGSFWWWCKGLTGMIVLQAERGIGSGVCDESRFWVRREGVKGRYAGMKKWYQSMRFETTW